jgi:hypothetical protein
MHSFLNRIHSIFQSKFFYVFVIAFFVFESAWLALSGVFPGAFDENFHFGLIQVYSHYWLPFLKNQPPNANAFGAVFRDPSYLYHYFMSFPYRLIQVFTHDQTIQILLIRFIDIGLFAVGLIIFRKILLRVKLSKPLANISILLFALIPIVPQLASQINYDDLLFPLIAITVLLTFNVVDQLRAKEPSLKSFLSLATICTITSLVKYAFLPIFLGIVIFILYLVFKIYGKKMSEFFKQLFSFKENKVQLIILSILFVISLGMFFQRDVINLIEYHSVEPSCNKVLTVSECSSYSVWNADYSRHESLIKAKPLHEASLMNIFSFSYEWVYWMWYRLFFVVNGPVSLNTNYPPLPLPAATFLIVFILGVFSLYRWRKYIFRENIYLSLLLLLSLIYIISLFLQAYSTYRYTGYLENMNGRYLLPVMLFLAAIFGSAISKELGKSVYKKTIIGLLVILLFLQGGGFITFISRSDATWDQNNQTIIKINNAFRKVTNKVVVHGDKTYTTKVWLFN